MRPGKNIVLSIFTALSLSFGMTTFAFAVDSKTQTGGDYIQKIGTDAQINWTDGFIKVTGTGAPPDKGNPAQRRLMALRAAKVDAYRQLLEVTEGVHVSSETIVKDFVTESDIIKTQVSGLVKGAQQVGDPRYMSDGSVEVDIQIKIFGGATENKKTESASGSSATDTLSSIMIPQEIEKRKTDDIPSTKVAPITVNENYTSVIIDCKGLGIQPAMSPAIFDSEGGEIYFGDLPMDADYVINEGIVTYTTSIVEAKKNERAGGSPLIIKAKKLREGAFKSDVIISNDDAKKLIGANLKSKFLNDAKVIFLI